MGATLKKKIRTKKNEKVMLAKKRKFNRAKLAHLGKRAKQTKVPRGRVSRFGSFFFGGIILNWLVPAGAERRKQTGPKKNENEKARLAQKRTKNTEMARFAHFFWNGGRGLIFFAPAGTFRGSLGMPMD